MMGGRRRRYGGDETEEEQRRKNMKPLPRSTAPIRGQSTQVRPPPQATSPVVQSLRSTAPIRGQSTQGGRRTRRMRGGMGYGFGGTIGTAGPVWGASWGGEITKSGEPIYDTADRPPVTGGRRRKSRKTAKKTKKSRRKTRKMRGGMSVAHASAGFAGDGERGLATYRDVGGSQPFSNDVVPLK
jgi:hypothetical protein